MNNLKKRLTVEKKEMKMLIEFDDFVQDPTLYSEPWGAIITFDTRRPNYRFVGRYTDGAIRLYAHEGDIVAFGQRGRQGIKSRKFLYLVAKNGELEELFDMECAKYAYLSYREWKQKAVKECIDNITSDQIELALKAATDEQIEDEWIKRAINRDWSREH